MTTTIQDVFLESLVAESAFVHIYLINGIKLQGHIIAADKFTIKLKHVEHHQLVFKHAVATIMPAPGGSGSSFSGSE